MRRKCRTGERPSMSHIHGCLSPCSPPAPPPCPEKPASKLLLMTAVKSLFILSASMKPNASPTSSRKPSELPATLSPSPQCWGESL